MLNGKTVSVLTFLTGLEWIQNQTLKRSNQYRPACNSTTKFDAVFVIFNP